MLAVLIVFLGLFAILNTATDIFPNIKIPITAVIWRCTGLLPEEMANRIVLFSERTAQTTVNDVEHTESQSVNGTAVVKYFFQPHVNADLSFAQITAGDGCSSDASAARACDRRSGGPKSVRLSLAAQSAAGRRSSAAN
jgi:multidrug efflux pump subunit AcrB